MEFFNNAREVRLKSHLDKYLVADEDQKTVRQDRNGSEKEACWFVESDKENPHFIRLKSCHGKYLCASDDSFLLGMTGKKVVQSLPISKGDATIDWEPITEGYYQIRLRNKEGGVLRANGGIYPWKNSVTHDLLQAILMKQKWVVWQVEVVGISRVHSNEYLSSDDENSTISHSNLMLFERSIDSTSLPGSSKESFDMEIFKKAKVVRLRSHHDTYLLADPNEEQVSHRVPYGKPESASWTVEFVDDFDNVLRLKSCFGKYLTATEDKFLTGMTGHIVKQTMPTKHDSSIEWELIRVGAQVKLKTRKGSYLRANGGVPPWNHSITHGIPRRHTDWILWEVEVVEIRPEPSKKIRRLELLGEDFSTYKLLVIFFINIMTLFFLSFIQSLLNNEQKPLELA